MSEPSRMRFFNISSDLVFDYGISEVIRKIAGDGRIPFVLRMFSGAGAFR